MSLILIIFIFGGAGRIDFPAQRSEICKKYSVYVWILRAEMPTSSASRQSALRRGIGRIPEMPKASSVEWLGQEIDSSPFLAHTVIRPHGFTRRGDCILRECKCKQYERDGTQSMVTRLAHLRSRVH
jgi:hypothetical protein